MVKNARKNEVAHPYGSDGSIKPQARFRRTKWSHRERTLVEVPRFQEEVDDEYDFDFIADNPAPRKGGWIKRANILTDKEFDRIYGLCDFSNTPESDRLKLALSHKAALRVAEISGLTMRDVTTAGGDIASVITIPPGRAKNKRLRQIPMHPLIREALIAFRKRYPDCERIAVSSLYNCPPRPQSVSALTTYMWRLYRKAGLEGCSSHSGRRTCITNLARLANTKGKSIRDVQRFAGHARLDTTEAYIEPSGDLAGLLSCI